MRRAVVVAMVLVAACSSRKRQTRSGDAAPVEVVTPMAVVDGRPAGAGADEVEPNDGDDVATPLALDKPMQGKIEPDTDIDHFRIEVAATGALAVDVTPSDGDVVVELEDASGTVVARSDRGGAKVKEGVPNFGVQPGRYTVVVKGPKKPAPPKTTKPPRDAKVRPGPTATYEIVARMVKIATNGEHEPDDDRATANELILGDTGAGWIGWDRDADVWKLSTEALSAKNALDIELAPLEGVAFQLELADAAGAPLLTRKAPRGAGLFVRGYVPNLPPGATQYHYITIRADRSHLDAPYALHVAQKVPEVDAEMEPNDTPDKAYAIPSDRTVVHASWSAGDTDCFAVAPDDAARTLNVDVAVPSEADLRLELFVDGKSIGKADRPGKGAAEKISGTVPAKAHAVVCVKGTDIPGEAAYDLTIHDAPAKP